jgi:hypothetical protein
VGLPYLRLLIIYILVVARQIAKYWDFSVLSHVERWLHDNINESAKDEGERRCREDKQEEDNNVERPDAMATRG